MILLKNPIVNCVLAVAEIAPAIIFMVRAITVKLVESASLGRTHNRHFHLEGQPF